MNERLLRACVRELLAEAASIITVADAKFAVDDAQAQKIKQYLEDNPSVAEPHSSETVANDFITAFKDAEREEAAALFEGYVTGVYKSLAEKPGGILDTLKTIAMDMGEGEGHRFGVDAVANLLFSKTGMPSASDTAVEVSVPPGLQPLFDVHEPGRSDTMGRGEVLLAFSYADSTATAGGDIDVTIDGAGYHVKDLRGDEVSKSDSDIALGKSTGWNRNQFPFNVLLKSDDNPKGIKDAAGLGELGMEKMTNAFPGVRLAYLNGEAPVPVSNADNAAEVAEAFQNALDEVVRNSESWGGAAGVVFALGGVLYLCGPNAVSFNRTTQNALRISPLGIDQFPPAELPYKAAMDAAANRAKDRMKEATTIEEVIDEFNLLKGAPIAGLKIIIDKLNALLAEPGVLEDDDPRRPQKGEAYTTYRKSGNKIQKPSGKAALLKNIEDYIEHFNNPPPPPTSKKSLKSHRAYADIRLLIRETLLTEDLTKSDKKEIEKITRKQMQRDTVLKKELEKIIQKQMKRDQIDKKEITKIARKEAEAEIKKSLGASFLGTPGKINQAIQDIAREEMQTALKGKELEKAAADVTKRVLYAFYKMMYNRKNLIDDIKLS